MKQFLLLAVFLAAGVNLVLAGEGQARTFYLQVVHGSDSEQPPAPEARRIGPKLSQRLHAIFQWKSYWELKRISVTLKTGGKIRTRMTADREVEIKLLDGNQMRIQIYRDGRPTRSERQAVSTQFWIVGGDKGEHQCWFIVVRQDEPPVPTKD